MRCVTVIGAEQTRALGLDRLLTAAGYEVRSAAEPASDYATGWDPDAVIITSCTAEAPPFSMMSIPRSGDRHTPILVLAPWVSDGPVSSAIPLRLDQCLVERFGPTEFIARLRKLTHNSTTDEYRDSDGSVTTFSFGNVDVNVPACQVKRNGVPVPLTAKEFDLLMALIRARGAIASRASLLQEVWGYQSFVVTRTVDIHIAELRRKLEPVPSEPRHFLTVRKRGYRFVE
jgi:DNA-binding response OmpR family regulator